MYRNVIVHRRLNELLVRCGLTAEQDGLDQAQWRRCLQALNDLLAAVDTETLQKDRALGSQRRELQSLFHDLASEHYKLQLTLSAVGRPLAGLDLEGKPIFSNAEFDRLSQQAGGAFQALGLQVRNLNELFQDEPQPVQLAAGMLYPTLRGGTLLGALFSAEVHEPRAEPTLEIDGTPGPLRVLVVDDEPVTRMIVEECVLSQGHACSVAEDGAEAWRLQQERAFHVIVSDWVMPGMTGVELCRQVRAHPGECYTYFILLTGKRQDEEVVHSLREAGADDYLSKPLNPADIERRLEVVARMAAHRRWVPAHV